MKVQGGAPFIVPNSASAPPDLDADLRCLVTISRRDERDMRQRQVLARIDDGPVNTLLFGDAVTCEVQPGAHLLRANNTLFWKRLRFSIEPGEHLEMRLINYAGRLSLGLLAILGVAPLYLKIECRSLL